MVYPVFIDLTRYTAEQRNFYWQYQRGAKGNTRIRLAPGPTTYPIKSDKISDKAEDDPGGNFGRLARYGIMEEFVKTTMNTPLRGLPAIQWLQFFKRGERLAESRPQAEPVIRSPKRNPTP